MVELLFQKKKIIKGDELKPFFSCDDKVFEEEQTSEDIEFSSEKTVTLDYYHCVETSII